MHVNIHAGDWGSTTTNFSYDGILALPPLPGEQEARAYYFNGDIRTLDVISDHRGKRFIPSLLGGAVAGLVLSGLGIGAGVAMLRDGRIEDARAMAAMVPVAIGVCAMAGVIAGALACGNQRLVTFRCVFRDGRGIIAQTDGETFDRMQIAAAAATLAGSASSPAASVAAVE